MQTYLFYDIETTGLNKAFDQVLHFAAIRTDMSLNEIERYELKVKLNPDAILAPRAMLTHRISIAEALQGSAEIDAIKQIHQWLNEPGTISLGYNTLGFDDEFLRFSFYRNLLPPYTHQFANGCSRMDLYPVTVMYYLYNNDALNWPSVNGETRLKLELLNEANQFIHGRSHHAMVDVEITLALAKRFMQIPTMWNYTLDYFNKQIDQERFQQLPEYNTLRTGIIVDGAFGSKLQYQTPAICLGEHLHYKNQMLWLRLDTQNLSETTENSIAENTWVTKKKWGEPSFIIPPKARFLNALSSERLEQVEMNKAWLKENPELLQKIIHYHRNFTYPNLPNTDAEACLYLNGFWSAEEMALCKRFHQVTPPEKAQLIEKMRSPTLKTLAIRLLGRNYPQALSDQQKIIFAEYLHQTNSQDSTTAIIDFKGNQRLSPQAALIEITELQKTETDPEQIKLLDGLERYLHELSLTSI